MDATVIRDTDIRNQVFRKSQGKSRITNRSIILLADGRSVFARRFKDIYEQIAADLGGLDRLSEGQKQLCRRAERLEALAARDERRKADQYTPPGQKFDIEVYGQICDRLGRVLSRLGLERRARPVDDVIDGVVARVHKRRGAR